MAGVQLSGKQVKDGSIQRVDIDVVTTGAAVITKVVGSTRVTLSSTGVDAGTGDVTLDLGTTGVTANTYQSVTVDIYGRVTSAGSLTSGMLPSGSTFYIQNGSGSQSASFNITGSGQMATLVLSNAGGKTLSITASSAQASNLSLAFPPVVGNANQVLMSDGANGLTWSSVGTVTSVGLSLPGIFSVTGSPVTTSGTLTATLATQAANTFLASVDGSSGTPTFRTIVAGDIGNAIVIGKVLTGYSITSGTINATDTILVAFQKLGYDKHVPVTIGTANGLSLSTQALSLQLASTTLTGALSSTDWNTFNGKQAGNATLTSLSGLSTVTTGLIKLTNGVASLDSSAYITANQTITLSGEASGSGTTSIAVTLANASVIGKLLTGYTATSGTIAATDSILAAIQKLGFDKHVPVTLGTANGLSLATQALSLQLATTTLTGALSSTDWNTFNNKQAALTNPITGNGSGNVNQVAVYTGTNAIAPSSVVTWDGTVFGIGLSNTVTNTRLSIQSNTTVAGGPELYLAGPAGPAGDANSAKLYIGGAGSGASRFIATTQPMFKFQRCDSVGLAWNTVYQYTSGTQASLDMTFYGALTATGFNASGFGGAARVLVSDASKNIVESAVTGATLAFLDATSSVQTQLNGKQASNATLTSLAALSTVTTGLVKLTNGTASLDSSVYITANQTITLSGGATGSGTTAITVTLSNTAVTGQALTGYTVGTNTALAATDTILGAFQKVQGQLNNKQASNATLTSLAALSTVTTGLVKLTNGTASLDTSAYLTANQSITLSGDATGTGTTAITVSLTNASVTGQALTGYAVGTNTALATTDTILGAFGKLQAQVSAAGGGAGAVCTMDRGNIITNNNLAVNGTASCYLTSFISDQAMTITSTSEFECYIIQNGGNLRYAIYDNTYALIAYSAQLTAPAAGRALASTLTFASGTSYTLAAGTTYYMGVFISAGIQMGGMIGSATYNTTPYVATRTDDLTMTPPGTLTASETTVRLFIRLKA